MASTYIGFFFFLRLHNPISGPTRFLFPSVWWTVRVFKGVLRWRDKWKWCFTDACQCAQRLGQRCEEDKEVSLTSVVGERAVGDEFSWLQAVHQRAHPPRTPEKRVSPRAQSRQLLHAPLFRAPVLEPHLKQTGDPNTLRQQKNKPNKNNMMFYCTFLLGHCFTNA